MNQIPTATLLVSFTHQDEQEQAAFDTLARKLSVKLDQPVVACSLDQPDRTGLHAITGQLQQGVVKIVILPLFLSQAEYQDNALADAVAFAGGRWPHAHFHLSPVPTWSEWLRVVGRLAVEATTNLTNTASPPPNPLAEKPLRVPKGEETNAPPPLATEGRIEGGLSRNETAVILVGQGSSDPDVNSDLTKLARLLYEDYAFGWVDVAFVAKAAPPVNELITRYQTFGAKQIIIIPHLLFEGDDYHQLLTQVEATQSKIVNPKSKIAITPCLSPHDTLLDVLLARHKAALEDRNLLPVSWQELQWQIVAEVEAEHKQRPDQPAADEASFRNVLAKINEILPPQYQGRPDEIRPTPPALTALIYGDEGTLRWDQMFGPAGSNNPFGDLALAGGASHRDELLETVSPADCLAEPEHYAAVLAEIERGIHTITGLSIVKSKNPGWIGIQCDSEEMAIWLVRAIIVENVMVRREEDVLYIPAGPRYTLENEILSVVTVVAKTWRFWIEHITAQQWQEVGGDDDDDEGKLQGVYSSGRPASAQ